MSNLPNILRYSSNAEPGYSRRRRGAGFSYHHPDVELVTRQPILDRIQSLGLPHAYQEVRECKHEFGHLQATGRDDQGRKQYRHQCLFA